MCKASAKSKSELFPFEWLRHISHGNWRLGSKLLIPAPSPSSLDYMRCLVYLGQVGSAGHLPGVG